MSDSDRDEGAEETQKEEGELAKEIEEKCWEAFLSFDKEGSGVIQSSEVRLVYEMMGI